MDKWILSKLQTLIKTVDSNLENYHIAEAARALAADVMTDIENTLAELFSSLENADLSEYLAAIRTINRILDRFPTGKGE